MTPRITDPWDPPPFRKTALTVVASALTAAAPMILAGPASAACQLGLIAELPVTMVGTKPMVSAKINGHDVTFMADSGAFYSSISPSVVTELKLPRYPGPFGFYVSGVGGDASVEITKVARLGLAGAELSQVEFAVIAGSAGDDSAGIIGRNILDLADVEFDLAGGAIRLVREHDCGRSDRAYWAAGKPVSLIDLDYQESGHFKPATKVTVFVNGQRVHAIFDSGAWSSLVSLAAAERAGIKPDSPGVVSAGASHGIGPRAIRNWIAPVASFKIGDEEIKNTRMRIGELDLGNGVEMLLGADFFLSHRIYVSNTAGHVYFTYNGGPVFNLSSQPIVVAPGAPPSGGTAAGPAGQAVEADTTQPKDAEGFSRRGAAYAARRDYEHAIADLTRACELAPNQSKYFFQRAAVRLSNNQPVLAMGDLDETLKLAPQDIRALVLRGQLRQRAGDQKGAKVDIDTASSLAPKEADVRAALGAVYEATGDFDDAIREYDLWIAAHADEGTMNDVLTNRCRSRAFLNKDLDRALGDCNRAMRLGSGTPRLLDSRGLVYLRMGQFDRAIADFDQVLAKNPKFTTSLYGRGLAKLKKGLKAEGDADVAAAVALQPKTVENLRNHGFTAEG
jgi:tetratricopeptide (TPR) repeat protein/predicted aspartyl protease